MSKRFRVRESSKLSLYVLVSPATFGDCYEVQSDVLDDQIMKFRVIKKLVNLVCQHHSCSILPND